MMEIAKNQSNESKVGKILAESTQKAVITLVLSMLLSAAVLDLSLFIVTPPGHSLGLKVLTNSLQDESAFNSTLETFKVSFKDDPSPILQIVVGKFIWNSG